MCLICRMFYFSTERACPSQLCLTGAVFPLWVFSHNILRVSFTDDIPSFLFVQTSYNFNIFYSGWNSHLMMSKSRSSSWPKRAWPPLRLVSVSRLLNKKTTSMYQSRWCRHLQQTDIRAATNEFSLSILICVNIFWTNLTINCHNCKKNIYHSFPNPGWCRLLSY